MNRRYAASCLLTACCSLAPPVAALADCVARSGPATAALVELYTSEGCSSCPPADRQMSRLGQTLDPSASYVPLSLHVGYWDYIGWKDPYAQRAFNDRQARLVQANRQTTSYTPHYFVAGIERPGWQRSLRDDIATINAQPAAAQITLRAAPTADGRLRIQAESNLQRGASPASLYLGVTESGLVSKVTRGENAGSTLAHDHVLRELIGPVAFAAGAARSERELVLPADWSRRNLAVVAFVQDDGNGRVLQAVSARQCLTP